ncbi:MAG TPA: NAD(P)-binding domain-containing protein [Thermomicrobiales bacterium]|nr:NAD(P)-binding domain-containing protein [Thermomicrobiales bacterium]
MSQSPLPVAVIGAGPVGLAAAAHLVNAGETPIVFEAGSGVGASMRSWSHVRVFSPWKYNVDPVSQSLLEHSGWVMPDPEAYPTGGEIVARYLEPLAALTEIAPHVRYGARVVAVTRHGFDKMKTVGRDEAPFLLHVQTSEGAEEYLLARAVIDASGTWEAPNPLGTSGLPAPGERAAADHIWHGIPDVLNAVRARYAGKRVLVVGSGHSAFNALADLNTLAAQQPDTRVTWAVRRAQGQQMYGGGPNDQLEERGNLGRNVERLVDGGDVELVTGFRVAKLEVTGDGVLVSSADRTLGPFDEIIATTGFRPDLSILSELRLDLDFVVESPTALAPLIDPNVHSCGTVRPHGALELKHPETDFYIAGMKSYGRAPTFLMLTGYEQVRSIVAALTGDWESALDVQLTLPETGVCTLGAVSGEGCCVPEGTGAPALVAANVSCCGAPEPALASAGRSACCG